jgi:O-antigen/teichoic acid export membrane protein
MSVRARLARASLQTFAGSSVHQISGVAMSIAAARILGPVHFGELAMTRTTLFTLTLLAGVNLTAATSRAVASARVSDPARAGRIIGLFFNVGLVTSVFAMLVCIALAMPIAGHLGAPQLATLIAVSAPYVVFASLAGVQLGALSGLESFAVAGRLVAFDGVVSALLIVIACYARGVTAAVVAMAAASAIAFVVRQHFVRVACREAGIDIRHRGVAGEMPLIRSLVVPAMLFGIAAQPFAWLARAMLARGSGGLRELGVFAAAYAWGSAVMVLPSQVTRPAMPILTNLLATGDRAAYRRLLRDVIALAFAASAVFAIPLMTAAPWVMRAYGASFSHGAMTLTLVAASSILGAVSGALRSALLAGGAMWGQAMQSLVWGVTLVAAFFAMRQYAANGLATAYVAAFAVSVMLQVVLLLRMEPLRRVVRPAE